MLLIEDWQDKQYQQLTNSKPAPNEDPKNKVLFKKNHLLKT